ncbi:MAG: hypothetical protein ACLPPF_21770 [Rhodomicrobium sp.]
MSEDLSILEDATPDAVSNLEALDDIADNVEAIVLNHADTQERDGYLALTEEYEAYTDTLPEEPALRSPEQSSRLLELEKLMETAFEAILQACPDHIRELDGAVRAAIGAEEAAMQLSTARPLRILQ